MTMKKKIQDEQGVALIIALMAMMLMAALGAAIVMTTTSETIIAGNFARGDEGLYAADAAVERALDDLLTVANWNDLISGKIQSAFVDGVPSGGRTLPDGSTIDIGQAMNMANCGKVTACGSAELTGNSTGQRPWGLNNPVWQAYAYGPLSNMLPTGTINSAYYVMVLVADDPSETDNNPLADGLTQCAGSEVWDNYVPGDPASAPCNPGTGVISLRAEAFGPRGAHKVIELTVARTNTQNLERGYTGQRGEDEQNRRARKAAVQTPGKTLTVNTMDVTTGGLHQ
jgi:type IV pilus assembly PilX-like protein